MKNFYYVLAAVFYFAFLFIFSPNINVLLTGDTHTDKLIIKLSLSLLFAGFSCTSLIMARIEQIKELLEKKNKKE